MNEEYLEYAMTQPMTDGEEIRSFFEKIAEEKKEKGEHCEHLRNDSQGNYGA